MFVDFKKSSCRALSMMALASIFYSCGTPTTHEKNKPTDEVNVFIGTSGGGHVHPGATTPFGLIALSPNTNLRDWANMGYNHSDSFIIGFVQNQVSGIGNSEYGNFLVMPARNTFSHSVQGYQSPRVSERAKPGFYCAELTKPNVFAELTATPRTGHHRFTFRENQKSDTLKVVINMSYCTFPQKPKYSSAEVLSEGIIKGNGVYSGGFGSDPTDMQAFFCAKANVKPDHIYFYKQNQQIENTLQVHALEGEECGVVLCWIAKKEEQMIELTTAVSYLNGSNAEKYIHAIEDKGSTFDLIVNQVEQSWNNLLGRMSVKGGTPDERKLFYTALYRLCLMPTDITGETPDTFKVKSGRRSFTNFFAIWDTYRTQNPLFALWLPSLQKDLLNSLLDIADSRGWLPDGFTGGAFTAMQGGTNADVLFADAITKKLKGVDYERALPYLLKNASDTTGDRPDISATKGRFPEYLSRGLLHADKQWVSVSKSLEYAYNDYCVFAFAKAMNKEQLADFALERSTKVFELFDSLSGFFRPKLSNGKWLEPFDPTTIFPSGEHWSYKVHFYEGSAWQYLGYVPHDFYGLIQRLGGREKFIAKWDTLFLNRFHDGYFTIWNEPDMLAVWQYIYGGRPDKTQYFSRDILKQDFKVSYDGYKGNDDSGTLSAWYVWASLGLFPNAGQDWYFIGSPVFTSATIKLENGNSIQISAPEASQKNIYVKSFQLNGKHLNRAWIYHSEIMNGATLLFEMTDTPTDWGHEELPPSPFGYRDALLTIKK